MFLSHLFVLFCFEFINISVFVLCCVVFFLSIWLCVFERVRLLSVPVGMTLRVARRCSARGRTIAKEWTKRTRHTFRIAKITSVFIGLVRIIAVWFYIIYLSY